MSLFLVFTLIALTTCGQLLFKAAAQSSNPKKSAIFNPLFIAAILCLVITPFITNNLFDYFSLSTVYSLSAIFYITVNLGAIIIFKEKNSKLDWFAIGTIALGVLVFNS